MSTSKRLLMPARVLITALALFTSVFVVGSPSSHAATAAEQGATTSVAAKKLTKAQKRKAAKRAVSRKARTGLAIARKQIGDPYRYGAAGPSAFDCSGLIQYSFRRAGFKSIPRTSGAQAAFTKRLSRKAMRPGDLMFFHSGGRVYHAAVFLGRKHGKMLMVHAPSTGSRVSIASPWTNSWYPGTLRR
ncbi:C40 family peptidase [Nocardioides sp. Bht2]|uniref:C40 family peptidase n=1 Tax=Nocardioides sp. Bht2 TaxID=3392297 RepID=UPI0039B39C12